MIIGLLSAMDRTATVYIARGEFQRAEILQRASQHPGKGVQSHFSTGLLAVIQGKFQEGRNALVQILAGETKNARGILIIYLSSCLVNTKQKFIAR